MRYVDPLSEAQKKALAALAAGEEHTGQCRVWSSLGRRGFVQMDREGPGRERGKYPCHFSLTEAGRAHAAEHLKHRVNRLLGHAVLPKAATWFVDPATGDYTAFGISTVEVPFPVIDSTPDLLYIDTGFFRAWVRAADFVEVSS